MNRYLVEAKDLLANRVVKRIFTKHRPGDDPNVFLYGTPRGGTTWLKEMIWSQPEFRSCEEPLDLRNALVRKYSGLNSWSELYSEGAVAKLDDYFERLDEGKLLILEPLPGRGRYRRRRTSRTVYKVIHGAEDLIEHLAGRFNGRVVLLLRHPVPVSLSRKFLPRLHTFLHSDYSRHFTPRELKLASEVAQNGSVLEQGVLDWCLQMAVPLRQLKSDWQVVTYEQLVLEPEKVIDILAQALHLPEPQRMQSHVEKASKSSWQSESEAKQLLNSSQNDSARRRLLERWREKVSSEEEARVMRILEWFGLDVYRQGDLLPTRYWLSGETKGSGAGNRVPRPTPADSIQLPG